MSSGLTCFHSISNSIPKNLSQSSPWPFYYRFRLVIWDLTWKCLCSWTPKPFNPWRLFILKIFGAKILGTPFVHQRALIEHPWNLCMHHRACLGDRSHAYCLANIEIFHHATVAQQAYLCTGTHDFSLDSLPLITSPISIGSNAFIGARSFILPGISIGSRSIVGACSVVTRSVPSLTIVAGNPAKAIRKIDQSI